MNNEIQIGNAAVIKEAEQEIRYFKTENDCFREGGLQECSRRLGYFPCAR